MIPQSLRVAATLASSLGLGALAQAQFTSVGPFTGNAQESFESQDLSGGAFPPCVVDRVFAGQADLCTENGNGGAHITGGWAFGCTIQEYDGLRFFGSTGGPVRYTFDSGATRFGGYFGSNNPGAADGVIEFFDAGGTLLHSDVLSVPNTCTWSWHGWDSGGVVIASVRVTSNYSTGGFMMMDGMQADLLGGATGLEYGFCDGNNATAPCGNNGATGNGCANSVAPGGAHLTGTGLPSLSANSVALQGTGLVPGQPGLYFQGDNAPNAGNGLLFGDGLRCAAGNVLRLQVAVADGSGASSMTADIVAKQVNSLNAGDTRRYQLWYRDPVGSPCGSGFNLTNGYEIVWQP